MTWPLRLRPIAFGGDYSPEQWPSDVQIEDVDLMKQAGVTAVTLGVFTWALLEPSEGTYTFDWLDEIMDRMAAAGIAVDLATPSANPPAWLSTAHPQILPIDRDGRVLGIGSREAFCPSSPIYRSAAVSLARRLAQRYADHPALALWHVGNEFGAHVDGCYCPTSERAFRAWLLARYGGLDRLNDAWGTTFWGQRYHAWNEITVPRRAPMPVNPAQQLDFMRFTNDEFLACYRAERDALQEHAPGVPVTTNFMAPTCRHIDYWAWAGEVDVVSNDHYLTAEDTDNHVELALSADLSRSLARGGSWVLMEHSTSAVNWQPRNIAKAPGEMRRNSLTHLARGADAVMFFQWRASRFGAEKFHSAMVPQGGTDTRTWREVCELGAQIGLLAEVAGSQVRADVGVVWDWQSWWALEMEYRPSVDVTYLDAVRRTYATLWRAHRTIEFVRPGDIPAHLPLLVVPSLYLCAPETAVALRKYVENGGILLVGFFSGIVDESETVHAGPFPGALRELLGLTIEEFHPLRHGEDVPLSPGHQAGVWSECVVPRSAEVIWTFDGGPDAGSPALTRNTVGRGQAWYLATRPDDAGLAALLDIVAAQAGLPRPLDVAGDVEVVRRVSPEADYLFVINHGVEAAVIPGSGLDLLTGTHHQEAVEVPAGGVAIVREDSHPPQLTQEDAP